MIFVSFLVIASARPMHYSRMRSSFVASQSVSSFSSHRHHGPLLRLRSWVDEMRIIDFKTEIKNFSNFFFDGWLFSPVRQNIHIKYYTIFFCVGNIFSAWYRCRVIWTFKHSSSGIDIVMTMDFFITQFQRPSHSLSLWEFECRKSFHFRIREIRHEKLQKEIIGFLLL